MHLQDLLWHDSDSSLSDNVTQELHFRVRSDRSESSGVSEFLEEKWEEDMEKDVTQKKTKTKIKLKTEKQKTKKKKQ